jgi:hypothetical protein
MNVPRLGCCFFHRFLGVLGMVQSWTWISRDPSLGVFWKDDIDGNPAMDLFEEWMFQDWDVV